MAMLGFRGPMSIHKLRSRRVIVVWRAVSRSATVVVVALVSVFILHGYGGPQATLRALQTSATLRQDGAAHNVIIGTLTPVLLANSFASSYPASAWRMMPMPGSVVSTRSMRLAISSVPSATVTCPACSE